MASIVVLAEVCNSGSSIERLEVSAIEFTLPVIKLTLVVGVKNNATETKVPASTRDTASTESFQCSQRMIHASKESWKVDKGKLRPPCARGLSPLAKSSLINAKGDSI